MVSFVCREAVLDIFDTCSPIRRLHFGARSRRRPREAETTTTTKSRPTSGVFPREQKANSHPKGRGSNLCSRRRRTDFLTTPQT